MWIKRKPLIWRDIASSRLAAAFGGFLSIEAALVYRSHLLFPAFPLNLFDPLNLDFPNNHNILIVSK
jgi:hypothetical protein